MEGEEGGGGTEVDTEARRHPGKICPSLRIVTEAGSTNEQLLSDACYGL